MAQFCTFMGIRQSPRTSHSPWTNRLVEVQNKNLGTHLPMFLHNTTKDWSRQIHKFAYAHFSQPLSSLNVSPQVIVFNIRPRIPLIIGLKLNRDLNRRRISKYCSELLAHSHYEKTDPNPFLYRTLSKPPPQRILAEETATFQIYSTFYG